MRSGRLLAPSAQIGRTVPAASATSAANGPNAANAANAASAASAASAAKEDSSPRTLSSVSRAWPTAKARDYAKRVRACRWRCHLIRP